MSTDYPVKNQKGEMNPETVNRPTFPWQTFFWEAVLFSLTLLLGILVAVRLSWTVKPGQLAEAEPAFKESFSFYGFAFYFLLATFFILLLLSLKKYKIVKNIIFKTVFIFVNFFAGLIALMGLGAPSVYALLLILFLILIWLKTSLVLVHNLLIILGVAGVGAIFGPRFDPSTVLILLAFLSLYDFIAVYKTKHMVKMAEEMVATGTILGLIIPQNFSDFKTSLKEVKPGGKFLILGGGDIAFPLLFCVSLISENIFYSFIVAFFSLIGLFFGFYLFINQKVRRPIPALPPIALFAIIGFLITKVL